MLVSYSVPYCNNTLVFMPLLSFNSFIMVIHLHIKNAEIEAQFIYSS